MSTSDTERLIGHSTPTSSLCGLAMDCPPPSVSEEELQGFEASPPTSADDSAVLTTSRYGYLREEHEAGDHGGGVGGGRLLHRRAGSSGGEGEDNGDMMDPLDAGYHGNRIRLHQQHLQQSGAPPEPGAATSSSSSVVTRSLLPNPLPYQFNPSGTALLPTVFLIVNAALGAGLLNFPKAFDDAGGVAVALTVQAVLLVPIVAALVILAFTADQNFADTIQEAMSGAGGAWGRRLTSLCVVVYCFGTTITFLIIIGDQFDRALASLYGHDFCYHWDFTTTVSSVLLILPFCYSKRIDFLRIPSMLGVGAILYIVGLVIYEYFMGNFHHGEIKTSPTSWTDVFLVVPDICFGYQCHVSVIPIYSCMRRRTVKHFAVASTSAVLLCALCYSLAATFGYLTFGSLVNNDILLSYDASRPEVLVAIVAMALKTYTTYPILLFCGREGLRSLLEDCCAEDSWCRSSERLVRFAIVTTWFALSLALSIFIPNIGAVIKLLGSLAAVFIFVLPGFGLFQYVHRSDPSTYLLKSKAFLAVSVLFLALGAFFFGVVMTQAVQYNMHHAGGGGGATPICVRGTSMVEVLYAW